MKASQLAESLRQGEGGERLRATAELAVVIMNAVPNGGRDICCTDMIKLDISNVVHLLNRLPLRSRDDGVSQVESCAARYVVFESVKMRGGDGGSRTGVVRASDDRDGFVL